MPPAIRAAFLESWINSGDAVRSETNDDLALVAGLRSLLPIYEGPPIRLFRGDSLWNRKRRTYGLSWSASPEVAKGFACDIWQTFDGGSVLLETLAPAEAVICAPHLLSNGYEEDEYLVDRRRLMKVKVIARFEQRAI